MSDIEKRDVAGSVVMRHAADCKAAKKKWREAPFYVCDSYEGCDWDPEACHQDRGHLIQALQLIAHFPEQQSASATQAALEAVVQIAKSALD